MASRADPRLGELEWNVEAVERWLERFEVLCRRDKIKDDLKDGHSDKTDAFISQMGDDAYLKLRNLVAPDKPDTKTFAALKELVLQHIAPTKRIEIAERYKFNIMQQQESEACSDWENRLRAQADRCNFKDFLKEALRDRFVTGLRSSAVLRELLIKDNLTLEVAVQTALAEERVTLSRLTAEGCGSGAPETPEIAAVGQKRCEFCNSSTRHVSAQRMEKRGAGARRCVTSKLVVARRSARLLKYRRTS